ncbi:MAG: energy-coupling factor transporter transmembrane component T family protein [Anaerolineae bacterium]
MSLERAAPSARRLSYYPGTSLLHRLHPLTKAAWLLVGTVAVFAVTSPWAITGFVVMLIAGFAVAGVGLSRVRGLGILALTALLLGLLQLLFVRSGEQLCQLGPLRITTDGVSRAVYIAGRFLSVILLSYLFVLTTEPNDLAYALMRAGLPYRYGFALITALRLVPTFEQEGKTVYKAQLARGVRYDVRSPSRVLTLARQFVLPLLVSALGKVDALAVSMEGRCFGKYPTRTFLREAHATWRDWVALGLLAGVITAIVYWRLIIGGF